MGSLNRFLGKPKEIDIDGEKLTIHPLKVKDMKLFAQNENASQEEITNAGNQILKLSIPDATDEEIDNLAMDAFIKIMDEVNKLNGFTDEKLDKIRRITQQKQAGN